jgi:ribosome-binding protein aMBF1 (putative translation factor)
VSTVTIQAYILTFVFPHYIILTGAENKPSRKYPHNTLDKDCTMDKFREKIKALRIKKGWAQEDLAREIDVSLSTVQRWEGKGARPTRHARRALGQLWHEVGIDND